MKDINEFLKLFVSEPDGWRVWAETPFRIDDKVYATDGHVLVSVPAEFAPNTEGIKDYKPENILSVVPDIGPVIQTITKGQIFFALKSVPTIREDKKCKC